MYYKELNNRIDQLTNKEAMPDLVIDSVNFRRAWKQVCDEDYEALADYLADKVDSLRRSGAEVISLTTVTMHVVFKQIVDKTGIDLVSIPQAVCDEALARGIRKVGLLGTIFTMEKDYMKTDLLNAGIQVVIPNEEERSLVAQRIFEELEAGIVKDSTLKEFNTIIARMRDEEGIEAVILGCTELPLLLNSDNCVVPCLDAVDIHLNELIRLAVE